MDAEAARSVAASILGAPVAGAAPAGGGGNSRLFRIDAASGAAYALKLYPPRSADPRDRLGAETGALRFLETQRIAEVPRLVGVDSARNCALLSWIAGDCPAPAEDADIDAALGFLGKLHAARRSDAARALPNASEACLTVGELFLQVEQRFARLGEIAARNAALAALLRGSLRPALKRARVAIRGELAAIGWTAETPVRETTLSPSDFGFHNALKSEHGRVVFLDFEYFGWDDPVKLVADTALHPRNELAGAPRARLIEGMTALYSAEDPFFRRRLALLTPLYGLRWCAILLNEFLPEKWAVRAHAGAAEQEAAQARQLAKAKALFETLSRDHEQLVPAL
jgi:hypothetical protein